MIGDESIYSLREFKWRVTFFITKCLILYYIAVCVPCILRAKRFSAAAEDKLKQRD